MRSLSQEKENNNNKCDLEMNVVRCFHTPPKVIFSVFFPQNTKSVKGDVAQLTECLPDIPEASGAIPTT